MLLCACCFDSNVFQDVGADFMNSAVDRFYKEAGGGPPSAAATSGPGAARRAVPVAVGKKKD